MAGLWVGRIRGKEPRVNYVLGPATPNVLLLILLLDYYFRCLGIDDTDPQQVGTAANLTIFDIFLRDASAGINGEVVLFSAKCTVVGGLHGCANCYEELPIVKTIVTVSNTIPGALGTPD